MIEKSHIQLISVFLIRVDLIRVLMLTVGKSGIHGFGIFAKHPHRAGDMVDQRNHFPFCWVCFSMVTFVYNIVQLLMKYLVHYLIQVIEYTGELVRPPIADRRERLIYNSLVVSTFEPLSVSGKLYQLYIYYRPLSEENILIRC